jgi:hypothetical protein
VASPSQGQTFQIELEAKFLRPCQDAVPGVRFRAEPTPHELVTDVTMAWKKGPASTSSALNASNQVGDSDLMSRRAGQRRDRRRGVLLWTRQRWHEIGTGRMRAGSREGPPRLHPWTRAILSAPYFSGTNLWGPIHKVDAPLRHRSAISRANSGTFSRRADVVWLLPILVLSGCLAR